MRLPILLCVVIFSLLLAFFIHKGKDKAAKVQDDFWERERKANSTRRKSLDGLELISIPLDTLPLNIHIDDDTIKEYCDTIVELSKTPIANLTGISNTDLKLRYGAPNLDILALYDQRYTTLASTLQRLAQRLYERYGEADAAQGLLEYAVSTRTDVSGSYKLLADIYTEKGDTEAIQKLIPIAESLNSPMKASILEYLKNNS